MKRLDIKFSNSSIYWTDFEGNLSVYYHFIWDELGSHREIINFIKGYIEIAVKYKIAVPVNDLNDLVIQSMSLYPLYQKDNNNYYYPTYLFINPNDKIAQKIISINPLIPIENSFEKSSSHGSIPIRVELLKREDKLELLCYLDNDVFNLGLENNKCREFEYPVDNSELAYLNTPRLNSFLRDLKKLCFEYGATEFEFENLGLNDFCEDGVMFNGEVIYYEDIVDLLEPHHRIVL
ncbi:hypothetical protein [Flavobacterium davisii]|uniref:hypothetical protein n=1 Tax=Flavobacterium davisii TaxID=2906077 RepID=UPI0035CEB629